MGSYLAVAVMSEVPSNGGMVATAKGSAPAIFNVKGGVFAIDTFTGVVDDEVQALV